MKQDNNNIYIYMSILPIQSRCILDVIV